MAQEADAPAVTPTDRHIAIDTLVANGLMALRNYGSRTQEQIDHMVKKASLAALSRQDELARLAAAETGGGVFEDNAAEDPLACEHVTHSEAGLETVDAIARDELNANPIPGPVGVICAMTPGTNPTSTTIFTALTALRTRNPVIFSFHPSAQQCSAEAARIIRDAAIEAGAPDHCVQWIEEPSVAATGLLMNHEGVSAILATGGNAMVKAARSGGKPAIGAGAGNVPAYVHKTAELPRAIHDIVLSTSFGNGTSSTSEQAVILDTEVYESGLEEFCKLHAHLATAEEKTKLEKFLFGVTAHDQDCAEAARLNRAVVGKSPQWIAEQAGFSVPEDTSVILAECSDAGPAEPLTREKLSPVLAVLRAEHTEHGLQLAERVAEFDGPGHSAAIHSEDEQLAEEFGKRVKAVRTIVNAPSTFGGIGDVHAILPTSAPRPTRGYP